MFITREREREESIPNLDDGKASSKEEYDSSVNANTDATKKEKMSEDRNGSAIPRNMASHL